jgi:mono/diheme cytochrome c family protein
MRHVTIVLAVLFVMFTAAAKDQPIGNKTPFPPSYTPSGEVMYKQFCAACHGADGKGNGPAASTLIAPPADLTTLAKRHAGQFPFEYVSNVLRFGPGPSAHGSSDMPTWGPVFQLMDKSNERAVQIRIKHLCDFLASVQER